MDFAALLIAIIPAAVAAILHVSKRLPRFAAIIGGFAVPFLIAAFPPLLRLVGHPLSPGLAMVVALAAAVGAVVFLCLEFFVKDHAKKPLMGRKGDPHHWRTQYATAALAVAVLMITANWGPIWHEVGHGWHQTWSGINRPGA